MPNLIAPVPGKVFKVNVAPGDAVDVDDEVIVLESMKMETPIFSPVAGTVVEVLVKEGDVVNEEDILAVIE